MESLGIYYANENHLSIILVEYLKRKTKEKCEVITVFEKGIQKEINKVIKESKVKSEFLKGIDFSEKKEIEEINVESSIFINKNLQIAKTMLAKENTENVKLIKCYKIGEQNKEIVKDLKENSKIVSTTGEHKIS